MIRINAPWLIEVAEAIDAIDKLAPGQTILDSLGVLYTVRSKLEQAFDQSIYGNHLRASRTAGKQLYEEIGVHINHEKWLDNKFTDYDLISLKGKKATFKTIFLADLSVCPTYIVGKKDNYDVSLLIEEGIRLFPSSIMIKAPEVEKDAAEVGRALAYELPTACGFHTFRIMEAVVRRYWDQASEGKDRPRLQTLGSFAFEMEKQKFGDEKVVEAIKQMTKLHRNPLIHPEVILTVEEAIAIIGMARSVIGPMLQILPDAPTTTGAAPLDFSAYGEPASPP
jgi:hypothetical protein